MADPTSYTVGYDFSGFADGQPGTPLPGVKIDVELANIQTSIAALVAAAKDVRRSDGALKNSIVTLDSLSDTVKKLLGVNSTDLQAVADAIADVTTVAGAIDGVSAVAGISADVTTVAGIAADVTGVAGISASVTAVATIDADVSAVAGIAADVTAVAADLGNIDLKLNKSDVDTDGTLAADSDLKVASQKATKMYVDARAVPTGGTAGQVLAKASATDRDTEWVDQSAGAFATKALAAAHTPATAPDFLRTAFYDTAQQEGSGALYKSNGTTSGDLTITLSNGTTVVGYDLAESVLRPEMFGRIGVNAAGDTAAWAALVAKANARGGTVRFAASGEYLISGTQLDFGSTIDVLVGRLHGATFRQQVALSRTFGCIGVGEVDIQGGHFYGYADVQITNGQTPSDYVGASSSYNGVAAIYCWECNSVKLWHIQGTRHAGGCLMAFGTRDRVSMCHNTIQGIGSTYIQPDVTGDQGNGVDFAMLAYPSGAYSNDRGWVVDYEYIGNRTWDSALGIMAVESRSLRISDNVCGPHPGQHCVYCIECDGLEITNNVFRDCRQFGFKNQLENYAGQFIGTAWASGTVYAVGDQIRFQSNGYVCNTAHTAGATFSGDSAKWDLAPYRNRNGGVIANNVVMRCEQALGVLSTSGVGTDGRYMWVDGLVVTGNKILDCESGIYMDRLKNSTISNNLIQGSTEYGLFIRYFGGAVVDNDIKNCGLNAIFTSFAWSSFIENNRIVDCGLDGTSDDTRAVVLNVVQGANGVPDVSAPKVFFENNAIVFSTGDEAGANLLYSNDTAPHWQIVGTKGTATTKTFKIDGTIDYQSRNHFAGYDNTAQNIPAYTITYSADRVITTSGVTAGEVGNVLCTLISDLQARKIVA